MHQTYVNQQDTSSTSQNGVSTPLNHTEMDPLLQNTQKHGQSASKHSSDKSTRVAGPQGDCNSSRVVPGVAFNATPIYDAKGAMVGLQTSNEAMSPTDDSLMEQNEHIGYAPMPPFFSSVGYPSFPNYTMNQAMPYSVQQHPYMHYNTQLHNHDLHQKPVFLSAENSVPPDAGRSTIIRGLPKPTQSFDTCPAVCSLFAIFCCPITIWCSLPALVYSMCAYTDYRSTDLERYQQKSDVARHLVITACIIGLLLCITWAILAFFYYELIITTIGDIVRVIRHRFHTTI